MKSCNREWKSVRETARFLDFRLRKFENDPETESVIDVHAGLVTCLNYEVSARHFGMPD